MKRTIKYICISGAALSTMLLAGCNPEDAANAKMAASRDAQFKAMAAQRNMSGPGANNSGATSAALAAKAGPGGAR